AGFIQHWLFTEGAYIMIQSTKPQTLGYGLNDSPVGLASWIVEKFYAWSDCKGDIETHHHFIYFYLGIDITNIRV
ncbi:MAG: hypothetical protein WA220_11890, partial [Candidatus Nitrosopolaris sp.]